LVESFGVGKALGIGIKFARVEKPKYKSKSSKRFFADNRANSVFKYPMSGRGLFFKNWHP
jgi:hypothetical protein